ncbi:MAG: hypothetical protein KGL39_33955 [Patescibacteria group bacterium]|nr:hypothetical protein [Patescibacteria group bacterium]
MPSISLIPKPVKSFSKKERLFGTGKSYFIFTAYGEGLPVGRRLKDEGNDVVACIVEDLALCQPKKDRKDFEPETPEDKKRRMSLYDGILKKFPIDDVVENLKNLPDKEKKDIRLFFDGNWMFHYAEQLMGLGYKGNFPTEKDRLFEADREGGKKFVEENYDELKVAEVQEFKSAQDGIAFLEDSDDTWVLKGNSEGAETFVPKDADMPYQSNQEIIDVLEKDPKPYEQNGFILERKITGAIELTPEIIFYDGEPICANVDIELKRLGAGDTGPMTGCSADCVFPLDLDSRLAEIAFPAAVFEMAKEHEGMFTWDASVLIEPESGEMYFGEFCSNRNGYNALYTELGFMNRVTDWFEAVYDGQNPYDRRINDFAVSVRLFDLEKGDDGKARVGELMSFPEEHGRHFWLMDAKMEKGNFVTAGSVATPAHADIAVVTGRGNDILEAVDNCYERIGQFSYPNILYRPKHDFLSPCYPGSIVNRFHAANDVLFRARKIDEEKLKGMLLGNNGSFLTDKVKGE